MTPMFASFMIELLFHFSAVACFVVAVALSCSFEEVLRGFAKEARGGQCAFTPEAHASLFFVTPNTLPWYHISQQAGESRRVCFVFVVLSYAMRTSHFCV